MLIHGVAPSLPTSDTEDAGPRVRIPAARNAERVNLNDSDDEESKCSLQSPIIVKDVALMLAQGTRG